MTEQEAQVKVIEYFINKFDYREIVVAIEVPFCEYKRRADVVVVVDGFTYGIEIKTQSDKIARLGEQIDDYKKIFDYSYIATEGKNFNSIVKKNYGNAGILKLDAIVGEHRKARQNKRLDKISLLSSLDLSFIKKQVLSVVKPTKQESIYETAKIMKIDECRSLFVNFIASRYRRRSTSFLCEIGEVIHTDDLLILSRPDADLS